MHSPMELPLWFSNNVHDNILNVAAVVGIVNRGFRSGIMFVSLPYGSRCKITCFTSHGTRMGKRFAVCLF